MYNEFNNRIMIVAIIEIGAALIAVEEFRTATSEAVAVTNFCNEQSPPLLEANYLGANADGLDLQEHWGWDFSKQTPTLEQLPPDLMQIARDKYIQRIIDGQNYFLDVMAQVSVLIDSNSMTLAEAFEVEGKLSEVKKHVQDGQWLSAQNEITTNVIVGGALTQAFYDSIKLQIDNYVTASYI